MRNNAAKIARMKRDSSNGQKLNVCEAVAAMHEQDNRATKYQSETTITIKTTGIQANTRFYRVK